LDARRVSYEIRLAPREAAWSAIRQREARYPGLLPGAYRLEVRARIGAGGWGPTSELPFAVAPAWGQTGWVFPLGALAGVAAAAGAVVRWMQWRTRQLHARTDEAFRAVIDLMPDLIAVYRDRKLIYVNRACCQLLGLDPVRGWADVALIERVHPDDLIHAA